MSDNSFIQDIGRSYVVSSLLPASLFASLAALIFRGFVPIIFVQRMIEQDQYNGAMWLIFGTLTVWVAFTLYSATDWVIRLYEGYYFPKPIYKYLSDFLKKQQIKKTEKIHRAIKHKGSFVDGNARDYNELFRDNALLQYKNIERLYPLDTKLVMPTRFGNILLTSELYPEEKYAMNSLALWTRLSQVLPSHYKDMLEEKNNQMIFLLNSSLLSYCISFVAFSVGIFGLPCQIFVGANICSFPSSHQPFYARGFLQISPIEFIVIGITFLLLGYLVYCLSIPATEGFGLLIRSGFDLYKFDLLHQMNYSIPKNSEQEKNLWRRISEYMIADNKLQPREMPPIKYSIRKELMNDLRDENEENDE